MEYVFELDIYVLFLGVLITRIHPSIYLLIWVKKHLTHIREVSHPWVFLLFKKITTKTFNRNWRYDKYLNFKEIKTMRYIHINFKLWALIDWSCQFKKFKLLPKYNKEFIKLIMKEKNLVSLCWNIACEFKVVMLMVRLIKFPSGIDKKHT